ncbi:MAG: hypothetical protein COB41_08030 [Proteobacteria bacterium]|nr:MAG: hypothetical protein COB41_08030 [Pseudomonadota bacterium]
MQDNLNMAIQTYRHALDMLQKNIESKKWDALPKSQALLDQASDTLRSHLGQGIVEPVIQDDLMQLSLQHRRVMRQLNQHMQRVNEDLQYVEKGLNKARYMTEFVENDLQIPS